jgi:hypothetical protein
MKNKTQTILKLRSRNLPADAVVVILARRKVNFSNLILAFLFVTSCIKVGENEEISQERSYLNQKRIQIEKIKQVLSQKCLALIRCQNGGKRPHENNRRRNVNKKKVGPFLFC